MAERHRIDVVSLVWGMLALSVAGLFFADTGGLLEVDGGVVAATAVIVFALCGLILTVRRLLSPREPG